MCIHVYYVYTILHLQNILYNRMFLFLSIRIGILIILLFIPCHVSRITIRNARSKISQKPLYSVTQLMATLLYRLQHTHSAYSQILLPQTKTSTLHNSKNICSNKQIIEIYLCVNRYIQSSIDTLIAVYSTQTYT